MPPRAIAFDAFGTLFDLDGLGPRMRAVAGAERGDELQRAFTARLVPLSWYATAAGEYRPFPELARLALASAARELELELGRGQAEALAEELAALPPYPDVAPTLAELAGRFRLAVLSNGTRAGLEALVESAGLGSELELLLAADEVGRYKPAAEVYRLAVDAFSVPPREVVLVSGNEWDVAGAKLAGLSAVWVARGRPSTGFFGIEPDAACDRLASLPEALDELATRGSR